MKIKNIFTYCFISSLFLFSLICIWKILVTLQGIELTKKTLSRMQDIDGLYTPEDTQCVPRTWARATGPNHEAPRARANLPEASSVFLSYIYN